MRWFRFSCFVAVEDDAKEPDAAGDIGAAIVGTVNCTVVEETIEPADGPCVGQRTAQRCSAVLSDTEIEERYGVPYMAFTVRACVLREGHPGEHQAQPKAGRHEP